MLLVIAIVFLTVVICFLIAKIYSNYFLFDDPKIKNPLLNRDIFSIIFGFSNILLISLVIEIAELDDSSTRNILWNSILLIFVIIMFYILPFYFIHSIIIQDKQEKTTKQIVSITIIFILYLLIANYTLLYFKPDRDYYLVLFYFKTSPLIEFLGNIILI